MRRGSGKRNPARQISRERGSALRRAGKRACRRGEVSAGKWGRRHDPFGVPFTWAPNSLDALGGGSRGELRASPGALPWTPAQAPTPGARCVRGAAGGGGVGSPCAAGRGPRAAGPGQQLLRPANKPHPRPLAASPRALGLRPARGPPGDLRPLLQQVSAPRGLAPGSHPPRGPAAVAALGSGASRRCGVGFGASPQERPSLTSPTWEAHEGLSLPESLTP